MAWRERFLLLCVLKSFSGFVERLRGRLREGIAAEGILGTLIDSIEEFERFEEALLEKGRFED